MPVVPEDARLEELERLGLSGPVIRLSGGKFVHWLFRRHCMAPPRLCYGRVEPPDGPQFVPLWDDDDFAYGVWRRGDRLEFLELIADCPGPGTVLAHTEQGFLGTLFLTLYEFTDRDDDLSTLREAAARVGFRFLDERVRRYDAARLNTPEAVLAFPLEVATRIDALVEEQR